MTPERAFRDNTYKYLFIKAWVRQHTTLPTTDAGQKVLYNHELKVLKAAMLRTVYCSPERTDLQRALQSQGKDNKEDERKSRKRNGDESIFAGAGEPKFFKKWRIVLII